MGINFQISILEGQIRECYGRIVWTHTTHQKCIDILERKDKWLKLLQIVLNAISVTGIITYIISSNIWLPIISAILTAIELCLNMYTLNYDINKEKNEHITLVNKLWDIREQYLSLLIDIKINILTEEEIIEKRNLLQEKTNEVYSNGPRTNTKAYRLATKALKENEEMTLHESEIDKFLPKELKRH